MTICQHEMESKDESALERSYSDLEFFRGSEFRR